MSSTNMEELKLLGRFAMNLMCKQYMETSQHLQGPVISLTEGLNHIQFMGGLARYLA